VKNHEGKLKRIVTATKRKSCPDEIDGVNFYFINDGAFLKHIAEKELLEHANVQRKYFSETVIALVSSNMCHGIDSLVIIDLYEMMNRGKNFGHFPKCIATIFIMPE
jgi:guanylate kinase